MFFRPFSLIFLSIMSGVTGQLLMKKAMTKIGAVNKISLELGLAMVLNPLIIAGIFLYAIAAILWLFVLSKVDLSYAAPIYSMSYVLIAILSFVFLKENLSFSRIIGILLICSGVFFIARS